jgi:hypothetical protein
MSTGNLLREAADWLRSTGYMLPSSDGRGLLCVRHPAGYAPEALAMVLAVDPDATPWHAADRRSALAMAADGHAAAGSRPPVQAPT